MVAVILRSAYVTSDGGEQEPCPFCGSTDTSWREGGPYSYDQIYCNHCLTEFTFYPPAIRGRTPTQTGAPSVGARQWSSTGS